MSATAPALIVAAAGVGFGHAVLPDHWVPLAVIGRTRRYPLRRVARLSGLAGLAHVLVSLVLGGIVVAVGLQFRSSVESAQGTIIGSLLVATGVGFAALELAGRRHQHDRDHHHHHHHHHHPEPPPAEAGRTRALATIMVPFGAAASPDLTILPVFLAASAAGALAAVGALLVFAAVTVATIVGLTVGATLSGYQVRTHWLDRWGNAFTAATLAAIGALVLSGAI